jgi:cobalt-zinc-cadmium resistance protein CzcA
MLTGVRGDLAIKIFGPDLATLNRLAARSKAR